MCAVPTAPEERERPSRGVTSSSPGPETAPPRSAPRHTPFMLATLLIGCVVWPSALLLGACAARAREPGRTSAPLPTGMPPASVGYLEGKVTIGPLRPSRRVDEPPPPVPPEVYAAYPIRVFKADGATWVADVNVRPDGTYRLALAPDTYVVALARTGIRIGRARDLPKTITIASDQTVRLDIDIDTGMR